MLATIFVSLPFVAREVVPTLREIGDRAGAGRADARRLRVADVLAHHAARRSAGRSSTASCSRGARASASTAPWRVVSGNIDGETQTATLRVEDAYQFAYGNYAPAYGISLVLAATAIVVLLTMILLQPKGARA